MHPTATCRCHHGTVHANKLSDFSHRWTGGRGNRSSPAATSTIDFQAVSLQISRDTLHLKAGRELGRVLVAYLPVFCCSARLFGGSLRAYAGSTRAGAVLADLAGLSRAELCARPPDVALHEPMGAAGSLPGLSPRRTAIPRAWRNGFGRAHLVPNHRAGVRRRSSQSGRDRSNSGHAQLRQGVRPPRVFQARSALRRHLVALCLPCPDERLGLVPARR